MMKYANLGASCLSSAAIAIYTNNCAYGIIGGILVSAGWILGEYVHRKAETEVTSRPHDIVPSFMHNRKAVSIYRPANEDEAVDPPAGEE